MSEISPKPDPSPGLSYRLWLSHPDRGTTEIVFIAPSDEAAALAGPYRCQADIWPYGTQWEVSRYDVLTVNESGRTVRPACLSNTVGSGEVKRETPEQRIGRRQSEGREDDGSWGNGGPGGWRPDRNEEDATPAEHRWRPLTGPRCGADAGRGRE